MGLKFKLLEKLDMYDMIIANLVAGSAIIEPDESCEINDRQVHVGFSQIDSVRRITKYFMITKFPDYLKTGIVDEIRRVCARPGVRINYTFYIYPYRIDWGSAEMRNKMYIWRRFSEETSDEVDIFAYRTERRDVQNRARIIQSTKYLNEAELEYKRATMKVMIILTFSADRNDDDIMSLQESIDSYKSLCKMSEIENRELRINMIDWIKSISPFSLKSVKGTENKLIKKVFTDDVLANFNGYRQGRVGTSGIPIGIDVQSNSPVLYKFKSDPDAAENWLISAATGGGKSLFIKDKLSYFMSLGYTVVIMDYEGDEYTYYADYISAGNPDDVIVVSMGKNDSTYFEPCRIADLTGDEETDKDLKEQSINFIMAIFRIIVHGSDGEFDKVETKIMSEAIHRMYASAGVTDDPATWSRSKNLRLHDVYEEIKEMVISKELVDSDNDNLKHKAATNIMDSASIHFEDGETYSNYWKHPMSAKELYRAQLVIFSFGMKGASSNLMDNTLLALKQLCVSYVNIQISNYCKYVKHTFNVKLWEEFQRYGSQKGSRDVIINTITGGRKRGDINFIITNNLKELLDDNSEYGDVLFSNMQNYAIGLIPDTKTRNMFCTRLEKEDCADALARIAVAGTMMQSGASTQNRYAYAFCVMLKDGTRTVVRSMLPDSLMDTKLYKTGVNTDKE